MKSILQALRSIFSAICFRLHLMLDIKVEKAKKHGMRKVESKKGGKSHDSN